MSERTYYVICADGCKFESMTKEQILTAIEQAVSNGKIINVDTGFVTKIKECNKNAALTFWIGTQAEYNALPEITENCFYIVTDDTSGEDFDAAFEELKEKVNLLEEEDNKKITALMSNKGELLYESKIGFTEDNAKGTAINENINNYSLLWVELGGELRDGEEARRGKGSAILRKTGEEKAIWGENLVHFAGCGFGWYNDLYSTNYIGAVYLTYSKDNKAARDATINLAKIGDVNTTNFAITAIYGLI